MGERLRTLLCPHPEKAILGAVVKRKPLFAFEFGEITSELYQSSDLNLTGTIVASFLCSIFFTMTACRGLYKLATFDNAIILAGSKFLVAFIHCFASVNALFILFSPSRCYGRPECPHDLK